MEHVGHAVGERGEVGSLQLRLDEREAIRIQQAGEVRLLDLPGVVVGEAVQPDHRRPARDERLGDLRPDEAGGAGDQGLHANAWRMRSGSRQGRRAASSAAWTVRPTAVVTSSARRTSR
jgi:hypothetical protein